MPFMTHKELRELRNLYAIGDLIPLTGMSPAWFYAKLKSGEMPLPTATIGKRSYWTAEGARAVCEWWKANRKR